MTLSFTAHLRCVCCLLVIISGALWVPHASAQTTGSVRGAVADRAGQPVSAATVSIEALDGTGARHDTSTDDTGHFQHTGLPPGHYSVTAEKDALGGEVFRVLVHAGGAVEIRFVLEPGSTPAPWLRAVPGNRAGATAFEAGVRATRSGDFEEAISQYETALRLLPTCVDCHFNIGVAYSRLERYADAEAAYQDALQVRSDYAAAYYGLADIYSRQGRTEEAAAARGEANRIAISSLAAGRASAEDSLTRGIAFWNSNNAEDAVRQFREALEKDASLAEPHYWLGVVYAASGDPDAAARALSRYLTAAPGGEHVAEARRRLDALER